MRVFRACPIFLMSSSPAGVVHPGVAVPGNGVFKPDEPGKGVLMPPYFCCLKILRLCSKVFAFTRFCILY